MGMKLANKAGYQFFLHSRNIRACIKSQRNCQVNKTKRPKVEVFFQSNVWREDTVSFVKAV